MISEDILKNQDIYFVFKVLLLIPVINICHWFLSYYKKLNLVPEWVYSKTRARQIYPSADIIYYPSSQIYLYQLNVVADAQILKRQYNDYNAEKGVWVYL